jgi:hypothetical protein
MKRVLTTLPQILITIPILGLVVLFHVPVQAQSRVEFAYPRSSEEFFNQGQEQLELEIQRLQKPLPSVLITISPELQGQMLMEIQQLEDENLQENENPPAQPEQPRSPTMPTAPPYPPQLQK